MSVESQPSISAMHPLLLIGVQFWVKDVLLGGWRDSKSLKFASRHEVRRNILCSRFHYPRSRGETGLGSLASFLVDVHHRPAFAFIKVGMFIPVSCILFASSAIERGGITQLHAA